MDSDSVRGVDRRRLLGWGGWAAAGVATGASPVDARPGHADQALTDDDRIPPGALANGQWMYQRAGGNPGVCANWDIYPYTGWIGVILGNCDGVPLQEMIGQEMQAITGAPTGGGSGG